MSAPGSTGGPPPLRDLPPPPVLPDQPPLPDRILLESRSELARRILRRLPGPAAVLLALWCALAATALLALAPTLWVFMLLFVATSEYTAKDTLILVGVSPATVVALLVLPLVGTALCLALVPVAARRAGRLDPRRFLSEQAFQDAFARRVADVLVAPAAAAVALLLLAIACRAPLPWKDLSYGVWSGTAAAAGFIWCARGLLRRLLSAPRVLGIEDPRALVVRTPPTDAARRATSRRLRAQDRRHLPPTDLQGDAGTALRGLAVSARAAARWCLPAVLPLAWLVFLTADVSVVIPRMMAANLSAAPSSLPWPTFAVGALCLTLLAIAMALAPLAAMPLARAQRAHVTDLRTVPGWAARTRANPWEARVAALVCLLDTGAAVLLLCLAAILLGATGGLGVLGWTWIVLDAVIVLPLFAAGIHAGMREGLRDVLYGPPGRYMRRENPWDRVAPELGTRTAMAEDPAVRARVRRAEQERERRAHESATGCAARQPGGAADAAGADGRAANGPPTGSFALPALPGGAEPAAPEDAGSELPDFSADRERPWGGSDPEWSRGADTSRHPIPRDVTEMPDRQDPRSRRRPR